MEYFTYNNKSSYEFGLIVTGLRTYGAPNRRVETVHVPGKNGDLLIDEGTFDNIIVSYDIAVVQDFEVNARAIAQWLLADGGYHDLWDTYNDDLMRRATYFNAIDFDVESLREQGKATINFYAKPQRFHIDYVDRNGNGTLSVTNPYGFTAKPLIQTTGRVTITVGDIVIRVNDIYDTTMTIDSETMQCYEGDHNCNSMVEIDEFPVIPPYATVNFVISGANSTITTSIQPRFWTL